MNRKSSTCRSEMDTSWKIKRQTTGHLEMNCGRRNESGWEDLGMNSAASPKTGLTGGDLLVSSASVGVKNIE